MCRQRNTCDVNLWCEPPPRLMSLGGDERPVLQGGRVAPSLLRAHVLAECVSVLRPEPTYLNQSHCLFGS